MKVASVLQCGPHCHYIHCKWDVVYVYIALGFFKSALRRQKTVNAYLKSEQLLSFTWRCTARWRFTAGARHYFWQLFTTHNRRTPACLHISTLCPPLFATDYSLPPPPLRWQIDLQEYQLILYNFQAWYKIIKSPVDIPSEPGFILATTTSTFYVLPH